MPYKTNINDMNNFVSDVANHHKDDTQMKEYINDVPNAAMKKRGLKEAINQKLESHFDNERKAINEFSRAVDNDGIVPNESARNEQVQAVQDETKAVIDLGNLAVKLRQLDSNYLTPETISVITDSALKAKDSADNLAYQMRAHPIEDEKTKEPINKTKVSEIANVKNGKRSKKGEQYMNAVHTNRTIVRALSDIWGNQE